MWEAVRSFFTPPISSDPAEITTKLSWLVRLRWLALAAQVFSIFPGLYFHLLEPRLLPSFVSVIAALALWNAATWVWLKRGWKFPPGPILTQLCMDILSLSALLALTGGAWNPLIPILFVHSVLGALLLEGRRGVIFFAILLVCVLGIQALSQIPPSLEGSLLPATILFPAQLLVALVFWILTAWLSRTLTALQAHLAEARERKTRIDRLRAVGALAAGLSHEFATPLNTAQLRLGRLSRKFELANDSDLVTAREELHRCGEVLHRMAGSQLNPERLSLEAADLGSLVRRVCTGVAHDHQDTEIRFSVTGRAPQLAMIPSVAFSQGLINLIENAIQASSDEAIVEVSVAGGQDKIDLTVADRGSGWPDVVKTHLGEPFVTTRPDGVGLGLYYVHSLSEAIGASLKLEDRSDGGAIARISLPRVESSEPNRLERFEIHQG